MRTQIIAVLGLLALATPALADGDAAKGEQVFNKCKACHSIVKPDGTPVVKGGMVGPDLYGVIGRAAASGTAANGKPFNYGTGLQALGKDGVVWTQALVAEYVKNPTAFVHEKTNDNSLRSNMSFMLAQGGEDVAAYLASVAPASN